MYNPALASLKPDDSCLMFQEFNTFDAEQFPNRYRLGMADMSKLGMPDRYKGSTTIAGIGTENHPYNIPFNPSYQFDNPAMDRLINMVMIREMERRPEEPRRGILVGGPSGGGKSSYIAQRHAYQGIPCIEITCRPDMEASDLLYTRELVNGNTDVCYSLGIIAALNGIPLILNEVNNLKPAVLLALNDFIEYGRVVIPETGEAIEARRGFVVHVTFNGQFTDDATGQHAGVRSQNVSMLRRFFVAKLGFPTFEQEKAFIQRLNPDFEDATASAYAKFVDTMHRASDLESGGAMVDGKSIRLSRPFNRSNLIDWLEMTARGEYLRNDGLDPAWWALEPTYYGLMPDAEVQAVRDIYRLCFSS